MNTKVQNFSLVEGSRSRIVIKLPDGADPYSYTVTAGNDRCQQRHLQYEVDSISDHTITMLSEPAPSCMTIPYQLFITDNNSHVEWFVISGYVTVIRRLVGGANTESQEIEPPLSEQVLELNVTLEYSKADLDEAVALALGAASNAQQSAVDAGSSAGLAWDYAQCAHRAVSDIGSSVESAWSAAGKSEEWSELARQYKEQSCCYKKLAFNYASSSEMYATTTTFNANRAEKAEQLSCQGATVSKNFALCSRKFATCAASSKSAAQLSASSAETWSNLAQCYKNQTCDFSTSASQSAQNAQSYKEAACSASITATSEASNAQTQAQCAYQWAQSASSSKTAANTAATNANNAKVSACSAAKSAYYAEQAAQEARYAACSAASAIFNGPVWKFISEDTQDMEMTNYNVAVISPVFNGPESSFSLCGRLNIQENTTAELYLDYGTAWSGKELKFPSCWKWINCDLPQDFACGHIYRFTVRNDGNTSVGIPCQIIANLAYEYQK